MKIIYKNIEVETNENTTVLELFKEKIDENKNIIACIVNNQVKPLNHILEENDEVNLQRINDIVDSMKLLRQKQI